MFGCTWKWFKMPFALSPFTQGTFSHSSSPAGTSVHLTPLEAYLARPARRKLLTLFCMVCFLCVWQAATAHRDQTEQSMGTCTWGWGRRYLRRADFAGLYCQGPSAERILFWKGQVYVCSSAVVQFNFDFPCYIFFRLLQSWSTRVEKYIYAPVMAFITVLRFTSHKGEMWRILPGSSQFSKLFCCLLLLLFHILFFLPLFSKFNSTISVWS